MSIVTAVFAACLLLLIRWRDLPLARGLHSSLVTPAARFLNGLTTGHWLLVLMLSAGIATVTWMGGDMIVVSALASPEILGFLAMVDVAALIDAALAAVALMGAAQGFALRQWTRRLPRPRGRRTRRTRPTTRGAANDDDPARVPEARLTTRGYASGVPGRLLRVRLETRGRASFRAAPAHAPTRPPIQDTLWAAG